MDSYKILPSILAADHGKFLEEVATLPEEQSDILHIDVMDGHFVPNISFGPAVVRSLNQHCRKTLDVHLMIENVDQYIPAFADAGADIITIHQEAGPHLHRSLALIRQLGAKAGVALNPATPLTTIEYLLDDLDLVLVMSVNPGFGGQKFIPSALKKLSALHELRRRGNHNFIIEVDGGIDATTAPEAVAAGAEYLVAGSAIFGKSNRAAALTAIIDAIDGYQTRQQTRLV